MNVRIKICGITNLADALRAVELGADALGFVFYRQSRRNITMTRAARICAALPPFVTKVGVFVDESPAGIRRALRECMLNTLQFHGNESPKFCQRFPAVTIKAIRVRDAASLQTAAEYDVDALLLDTYSAQEQGGTGQTFDWSLARQAKGLGRPLILSGGLTPENVAAAVRVVRPYAVDVSSGVERSPGKKDRGKLRRFIEACRSN